jgi:hypothetical protein
MDDKDFGYFEDDNMDDISDEDLQEMIDEEGNYKEEELRLTHVALRHQLLEKAKAFVSEGVQWRTKPLKQRLAELTVTYRMMTKLTEDE